MIRLRPASLTARQRQLNNAHLPAFCPVRRLSSSDIRGPAWRLGAPGDNSSNSGSSAGKDTRQGPVYRLDLSKGTVAPNSGARSSWQRLSLGKRGSDVLMVVFGGAIVYVVYSLVAFLLGPAKLRDESLKLVQQSAHVNAAIGTVTLLGGGSKRGSSATVSERSFTTGDGNKHYGARIRSANHILTNRCRVLQLSSIRFRARAALASLSRK